MSERFLDGSPVTPDYIKHVNSLINTACSAEEMYDLDELEAYTASARSDDRGKEEGEVPCQT